MKMLIPFFNYLTAKFGEIRANELYDIAFCGASKSIHLHSRALFEELKQLNDQAHFDRNIYLSLLNEAGECFKAMIARVILAQEALLS